MPLDPQIQMLVDNLPDGIALPVGDPVAAREVFHRLTVALRDQQPPADLAAIEDLSIPAATGEQAARIYRPHGDEPSPTLVFFHGGGFVVGDIESYDLTARTLAERAGATVVSVEYRLAPEHKFPAGIDDALAIADWALGNVDNLGGNRDRILVGGDSAGGNLSAVVAQQTAGREQGFSGQVLMYPVLDMGGDYPSRQEHADGPVLTETAARWFHELYLSESDETTDPRISPIHFPELGSLVPAVVATAGFDILRDEGFEYVKRLEAAGVPTKHLHFETLPHGFLGFGPLSAGADAAISEVSSAIAELARTGAAA